MSPAAEIETSRSRDRILDFLLKSEGPLSVQSLSVALGISRNAAHQQVVALEREGLIERDASIRTKGRPSQGYRLSQAGNATFTRQYALLARQLLAQLSKHLERDDFQKALEQMGKDLASGIPIDAEPGSGEAIAAIATVMRDLGYESSAVEGPDGAEIEAHNCVFHDLAFADPAICEVDLSLLRALSGKTVEHRRCMALGERSCRFAFKAKDEGA